MSELAKAYDPQGAAKRWSAAWNKAGVYTANPDAPGEPYSIVIPPPNVTGSLHMGHALNNTLQDVLVRYKRMDGYNAVWVPGTDHAGIATQWVVRKQLAAEGVDFWELGRERFVERVWQWKEQAGGRITHQLRELGVSCDWSRERFTLDDDLQAAVAEHFVRLYEEGLIYRGERLINWDPVDRTALSNLEVEYPKDNDGNKIEEKGELYSFAYPIPDEHGGGEIVVATTRPETMLGDTAVAVHPDDERYQHLIGKFVQHPFVDRQIPIVADAILVNPEFGTGCVKITPAHDFNDFEVGKRHDLPMINIFNEDATVNANGGKYEGMDRYEARDAIKADLDAAGLFRGTKEHFMAIGRGQRSGAVVEPMLSTQWFVSMKPLAGPALAAVEHGFTRFVPKQWENTYYAWLRDIRDWCISRQLWWGHRIPAWYDASGKVYVARSFEEAAEQAGTTELTQDSDVLDTWFSSALWPFSVFGWPEKTADLDKWYPTSVLITGFDIIFFWVARMMFAGQHFTGSVPFRDVYIHALVRDEHGHKMSKTKGNVVDPLDMIDKWGADAFRFTLVEFAAQGRDILWNEKSIETSRNFTTKIWQALTYGSLWQGDYDPDAPMEFGLYERWIRHECRIAIERVRSALDNYKFNEAAKALTEFTYGVYCSWYIELSKTTKYDDQASAARKNGTAHVLYEAMGVLARLSHPMMPFLSEEIWATLPDAITGTGFITTAPYPQASEFEADTEVARQVALLQQVITRVRTVRGEMEIAKSKPMRLLTNDAELRMALHDHGRALRDLAGVVGLEPLVGSPGFSAPIVVNGSECHIPLDGIVDRDAEISRLNKTIKKAKADVDKLSRRATNPKFLANAKPDVVAEVKERYEAELARVATLEKNLARMMGS